MDANNLSFEYINKNTLWDDAKWLNRAEDYKEEMDSDIGYLLTPPEDDLDI